MTILESLKYQVRGPSLRIAKTSPRTVELAKTVRAVREPSSRIRDAIRVIDERMSSHEARENYFACSSTSWKRAVLESLVSWAHSRSILEVGTAYGVGSVTLALSQHEPNITTIERQKAQSEIGAANIAAVTTGVQCIFGSKEEEIPRLAEAGKRFDFVFHDGGHSGDAYVADFEMIHPMLERGSVFVIDDINWDAGEKRSVTQSQSKRTCMEGWNEVVEDARVEGAVIVKSMGVLILK